MQADTQPYDGSRLTPTQRRVLALKLEGLTIHAIAIELMRDINTVKVHLHAARQKLGGTDDLGFWFKLAARGITYGERYRPAPPLLSDTQFAVAWRLLHQYDPNQRAGLHLAHRLRGYMDGALWIDRTGRPQREVPDRFGTWQSVAQHYAQWRRNGFFTRLAELVKELPAPVSAAELETRLLTLCGVDTTVAGVRQVRIDTDPSTRDLDLVVHIRLTPDQTQQAAALLHRPKEALRALTAVG